MLIIALRDPASQARSHRALSKHAQDLSVVRHTSWALLLLASCLSSHFICRCRRRRRQNASSIMNSSNATPGDETTWVDAWVRWERNSMAVYNDEDEAQNEEDDQPLPPPTERHQFTYPNEGGDDIFIELKGFESESEQTWTSTGLTLWRSSQYLCDYLVDNAQKLQDKRILELGSGLGRSGILAGKLLGDPSEGGSNIYLTDGDSDTLLQLRANIELNSPLPAIRCHQLLWGSETAQTFLKRHASDKPFDIIFGSDLIYVEKVISPLFDTVQTLLSTGPNAMFIMAHCCRRQGNEVDLVLVLAAANRAGFEHSVAKEEDDIFVFVFQRRKDSAVASS